MLRGQLDMLQQRLLESQDDYRRCIASHSVNTAAAVRRGYAVLSSSFASSGLDAVSAARAARKAKLIAEAPVWFTLETLVPQPREAFDVVYVLSDGATHNDEWLLQLSVQSLSRFTSVHLSIGAIYILCNSRAPPRWWSAAAYPLVHTLGGSLASNLANFRDHILLVQDSVLFGGFIDRDAFWESRDGWGPQLRLQASGAQSCGNTMTDALLDKALAVPVALHGPRRCVLAAAPIALHRATLVHLLNAYVGQLPLAQSRNSDIGIDLVHFFAHWMLEHNLVGSTHIDARDVFDTQSHLAAPAATTDGVAREALSYRFVDTHSVPIAAVAALGAAVTRLGNAQ